MIALTHPMPMIFRFGTGRRWENALVVGAFDGSDVRRARPVSAAFVAAIFLGELAWAFFGSLGLGLTGLAHSDDVAPWIWLGGAIAVAVLAPLARWMLVRSKE